MNERDIRKAIRNERVLILARHDEELMVERGIFRRWRLPRTCPKKVANYDDLSPLYTAIDEMPEAVHNIEGWLNAHLRDGYRIMDRRRNTIFSPDDER
ncbi:MAG: hypothetical protein FWH47_00745 [Methanomassiliicoccaceae archaeon]|nr:hypothetical protein [Methanomassiliicoccaceae archaeon]